MPSPPLFSLHKGNFEDPLNTKTKHILNFKTSVVNPRHFDHNLCQQVNKFMNMNFLICSRGLSQKQCERELNKMKHIYKILSLKVFTNTVWVAQRANIVKDHVVDVIRPPSPRRCSNLVVPLLVFPVGGVVAPI